MKNLGAVASRFLSIVIVLQVLGYIFVIPTYFELGRSNGSPYSIQLETSVVIITTLFALACTLWMGANRFAPSVASSGQPVSMEELRRLAFSALGVYLLTVNLTSLATELAATYSQFTMFQRATWQARGWAYGGDAARVLIGLGLVLFNRPTGGLGAIVKAANWPRNEPDEPAS